MVIKELHPNLFAPFNQNAMPLADKINHLHEATGLSQVSFASLVGVNVVTLRRMKARGDATDRVLERLASSFQGLTADMLRDDEVDLPDALTLRPDSNRKLPASQDLHEGRMLGRYLDRLGRGSRSALAEKIGVSRPQVNSYEQTERFRPEVRQAILDALGVEAQIVFTNRILSPLSVSRAVPTAVDRVALPLIGAQDRDVTPGELAGIRSGFAFSAEQPGKSYLVDGSLFAHKPGLERSALAVAISAADNMEPRLTTGAVVLAEPVAADALPAITADILALILPGQGLRVCRVYCNNLRSGGTIEVGPFDRNRGSSVTLRQEDIASLYRVTAILYSPL